MTSRRVAFARIFVAAAFVAACSDAVSPPAAPERGGPGLPMFDVAATGDQNGGLNQSGTVIGARFPTNPHRGDAIIATFFWLGSTNTNIIDSVTDFLTDANSTRVGNTYRLVEYVGAGGVSMATYVATNVQNFPDPSDPQPTAGLAVRANLSTAVTDGGILISAWSGVADVSAEHHSASGAGSTPTVAAPGATTICAGSLAYGVTMSNAVVGRNGPPQGFTNLAVQSDASIADQADYLLSASGGTADPRWTWNFSQPSTWLATVLSLTTTTTTPPPPPPPGGSGNLTATATTSGSNLDPDRYTVTVDGTTSQPIATNGGSVTFTGLASGSHTVAISGVAPNCTVSGGTSQTVSVPSGGTATASFSVTCTARGCDRCNLLLGQRDHHQHHRLGNRRHERRELHAGRQHVSPGQVRALRQQLDGHVCGDERPELSRHKSDPEAGSTREPAGDDFGRRAGALGLERRGERLQPGDGSKQFGLRVGHDVHGRSGRDHYRGGNAGLRRVRRVQQRRGRRCAAPGVYARQCAERQRLHPRGQLPGVGHGALGRPAVEVDLQPTEHLARHGPRPQPGDGSDEPAAGRGVQLEL